MALALLEDIKMNQITKERATKLLAKGAILVDMRTPVAFRDGHVAESQNLPLKQFTNLLMKTSDKKKSIIVYGDSVDDADLKIGINYATQLGFSQVYVSDYKTLK